MLDEPKQTTITSSTHVKKNFQINTLTKVWKRECIYAVIVSV